MQVVIQPDLFTEALRNDSYKQLREKGLSASHEKVMNALRLYGKADYHMIAEHTGLPVTSVTGRVKELREKALIDVAGSHVGKYGKEISLYTVA